jgi:hypothetical protein
MIAAGWTQYRLDADKDLTIEQFCVAWNEVSTSDTSAHTSSQLPTVRFAASKLKHHAFGAVSHGGVELHPAVFFRAVHASGGFPLVRDCAFSTAC